MGEAERLRVVKKKELALFSSCYGIRVRCLLDYHSITQSTNMFATFPTPFSYRRPSGSFRTQYSFSVGVRGVFVLEYRAL